ncbi:MAG TPA: helicase-exonuclease AddAB subunit AddB [Desulfitobacteriaceae bacterium]|nr:helicase-exonuclease AddAB subunit AddB [Desulfitobacteriaceae bacterium]
MSLRFICGRAGSGKTSYCLHELKTKIRSGVQPLVLLVPEQFSFQAEKNLIAVLESGGILKTEVLSFRRLAFRIFNEVGGITYPHIHAAGKSMIVYRILDKMKNDLKVFANAADRQGFVNTLTALFTEFKQYDITPEKLAHSCADLAEDNPLQAKLLEIQAVYAAYEKTLAGSYSDSDDDLTLAAEKLNLTDMYAGAEIWLDGFSGFTPQEYKLIAQLLLRAERVNISLGCDRLEGAGDLEETDVFAAVKRTYRRLIKIARELGIETDPPVILSGPLFRFQSSPELAHLEQNLYAYPSQIYREKTLDISLFSAVNIFSEIEAAARDIVRLCRDKGLRYRDIAVVVRNLADYQRQIEVIFADYEIPCFIDQKVEISNHPLVRLLLSMMDIFIENWSYEAVFRYLKTGLTGIEQGSIDQLENYVLACGIRGSRWTNGQDWTMSPGFIPEEKDREAPGKGLEEINRIKAAVCGPLLNFRRQTKGRRKAAEFCSALYDFLCELGVSASIEALIERFKNSGQLSLASEASQVWNIVMEVFDQTVEVMGKETFGLERFANILKIGLGEYKLGLIPAALDQVLVGSVDRSRSPEVKALYILGTNDGVFPAAAAEEGILSDLERAALNKAGLELAGDTRSKIFDEQYQVYRALTTGGSFLRLSWPIADHEGRTLRPSLLIARLRKLFPAITETSNILKPESAQAELELVSGKAPAFREMVAAFRRKAGGRDLRPLWPEVYRWFAGREDWQLRCESVRAAFRYKNLSLPVSKTKITALYGDPAYSSVSRLEQFSSCPFAYFVRYGLGAKDRKIYRLNAPDVGTFMHAVLERFSAEVVRQNLSWRKLAREWSDSKVGEIIQEMLEKMQGSGLAASKRYTALTLRLKRVIARAVWLIAEHIRRSSFEPLGYELDFGDGGQLPPIIIELESGEKVRLTGRIDRVDASRTAEGTYLRIIDYKSGAKDFKLSDVFYGLQLQLLTYLDALGQNCGLDVTPPVLPGGILYFRLDDPMVKEQGKIREEEIELAIMKQLKMKGLLLADVQLVKAMDSQIDGASLIIPARINKGGVLGKSSAASLEQFRLLRRYVSRLLRKLGSEIMQGNAAIRPYRKKAITSCSYCSYAAVCQFDPAREENTYKTIYERKDEEVWSLLAESSGAKEGESHGEN